MDKNSEPETGHKRTPSGYIKTGGEEKIRVSLMLTKKQRQCLRMRAHANGKSVSEWVIEELDLNSRFWTEKGGSNDASGTP